MKNIFRVMTITKLHKYIGANFKQNNTIILLKNILLPRKF